MNSMIKGKHISLPAPNKQNTDNQMHIYRNSSNWSNLGSYDDVHSNSKKGRHVHLRRDTSIHSLDYFSKKKYTN